MSKTRAANVLDRLQELFEVDTDSALADAMAINRQTLGSWRSRDRVPYEECVNLAIQQGVSLDWLLIGEGEIHRDADASDPASRASVVLSLLRQLPDDDQHEIELLAQGKKRLRDMEQQLEQVTSALTGLRTP
jgi:hypothetical protein